ncbi:MAG: CorA family divalent cation transporter [Bacillota bacterium]
MKIAHYFTPKTYMYSGKHTDMPTTIKDTHYGESVHRVHEGYHPDDTVKHYIQVVGLTDVQAIKSLLEKFNVHPLQIEDVFNPKQRDKIEVSDHYVFAAMHVDYIKNGEMKAGYFTAFLFDHVLVTFHETPPEFLTPLPELLKSHGETRKRSSSFLFYQLLDMVTDHHLLFHDHLTEEAARFEETILENRRVDQEDFYTLRKQLLSLKNSVSPIKDDLRKASFKKSPVIHEATHPFYDDLLDHLARLDSNLYESRELMRHLLDLHINNQSHRMNQIMTTLTLFSAIFIPLSFLTGFFGMNFVHFEVLEYEHAIALFIGACITVALFMVLLFKRMRWF